MSQTDSFIDEVSEELRRDQLFALLRRYGWIAALAVVLVVGGAAWNEYRKAQSQATAEAFGDAILSALDAADNAARVAALQQIEAQSDTQLALLSLLIAGEAQAADDAAAVTSALDAAGAAQDAPQIYRDIALFKAATADGTDMDASQRNAALDALAARGGMLRLLAWEQQALLALEGGDKAAAIDGLSKIMLDADATSSLRSRAGQMIIALGGKLPDPVAALPQ